MDKLLTIARAFLQSIKIIFIKISDIEIDYDIDLYTAFEVTIANPNNDKSFSCRALIDNIFVSKNKVSLYAQYSFLMEIILDYLYKIDDNPNIRNEFSKIFNEKEIELLVSYFKYIPNFKKVIKEIEDG